MGLQYIKELWNNHGFEIVLGLSLAFIIIFALYKKIKGDKGTWSKTYPTQSPGYSPLTSNSPLSPSSSSSSPSGKSSDSKGEIECRRVLQYLFKKPFNKARPDFLRNPVTGGSFNLELDCYQQDLNLAVEYSGRQHYEYVPYFHRNKEAFLNQKYRDHMKAQICKEQGINLVIIPYSVKIDNIKGVLEVELRRLGYNF